MILTYRPDKKKWFHAWSDENEGVIGCGKSIEKAITDYKAKIYASLLSADVQNIRADITFSPNK